MSRTVFILGAGASAKAGAPVMSNFITIATELARSGQLSETDQEAFNLVFKARTQLQSVFSKATVNLNNVESLFGAFEMATLLGKLGDLKSEEIKRLAPSIVRLISRTIERRLLLPVKRGNSMDMPEQILAPVPYPEFGELLKELVSGTTRGAYSPPVSVITFNYDLALDFALFREGIPISYCLNAEHPAGGIDFLKLHGSLNWARCSTCHAVIPWGIDEYLRKYSWGPFIETPNVLLEVSAHFGALNHCNLPIVSDPVIVPPTWNKGKYHAELASVWKSAAQHLAEAENIFVIGYSLPGADEFFKYFYALGSVGSAILNTFWIIDPAADDVGARFGEILGSHAKSNDCFKAQRLEFGAAISAIRDRLGLGGARARGASYR
jgi:hypothetical protein